MGRGDLLTSPLMLGDGATGRNVAASGASADTVSCRGPVRPLRFPVAAAAAPPPTVTPFRSGATVAAPSAGGAARLPPRMRGLQRLTRARRGFGGGGGDGGAGASPASCDWAAACCRSCSACASNCFLRSTRSPAASWAARSPYPGDRYRVKDESGTFISTRILRRSAIGYCHARANVLG